MRLKINKSVEKTFCSRIEIRSWREHSDLRLIEFFWSLLTELDIYSVVSLSAADAYENSIEQHIILLKYYNIFNIWYIIMYLSILPIIIYASYYNDIIILLLYTVIN